MEEEYKLWAVTYIVAPEVEVDLFNNGVLHVIARNGYEALGKALTIPGMGDTIPDPASFEVKEVELLHIEDSRYKIEVLDLSDLVMDLTGDKNLWEILVPNYSNEGNEYDLSYHKEWDEKVREISGGLTILKTAKGQWTSPDKSIFSEEMIPVRIYCDEKSIDEIVDLTLEHYNQEAVLAYRVSSQIKLVHRDGYRD